MLIPVAAIDAPPDNVRRIGASRDDDEALQRSIASLGVLQAVLVIANGDRYTLVIGARRLRAAIAVGLTEIPAELAPRFDEAWSTAAAAAENMVRSDMSPIDRWRVMSRLQAQGYTLPAASAALGLTERAGKRLDRLSKLHPDILAALERGDWPEDDDLGIIASAPPEKQAAALIPAQARIAAGPDKGCLRWNAIVATLQEARIPAKLALFDVAGSRVLFSEDLFAEPGGGEELYTTDVPAFIAAQKAEIERLVVSKVKGVSYQVGKLDKYGSVVIPKDHEKVWDEDAEKPKRGRVVLLSLQEDGYDRGRVVKTVLKPKATAKPAAKDAAPDDDGAEFDKGGDEVDEPARRVDAPPPADVVGISKKGQEIIAAAKTQALRACLRSFPESRLDPAQIIAGLVLLLTAPNVSIRGVESGDDFLGPDDMRARLINPAGHPRGDLSECEMVELGAETLARCLSVAGPDAQKRGHYNRSDSGEVAEWIGAALGAERHLPRLDDAEFLGTLGADLLRQAAVECGHKTPGKVAELRRALTGHLPDWRPEAAQFGAPGPRPRKDAA